MFLGGPRRRGKAGRLKGSRGGADWTERHGRPISRTRGSPGRVT